MTNTAPAQRHADHDIWPLISRPGLKWCRTCKVHFGKVHFDQPHVHAEDPSDDPHADLQARWLPSVEQMKVADALLAAGYDAERGDRRERGVFTTHLLVNKTPGFWTTAVEVRHLDGVYLTRDAAWTTADEAAKKLAAESGAGVVGGYAWHSAVGHAAVWEA